MKVQLLSDHRMVIMGTWRAPGEYFSIPGASAITLFQKYPLRDASIPLSIEEEIVIEEVPEPSVKAPDIVPVTEAEHLEKIDTPWASSDNWEPGEGIDEVLVTMVATRLAKREGVDLAKVVGTGKNGRIIENDVKAYILERG